MLGFGQGSYEGARMQLTIALCGLSARNARVLSYVINSTRIDGDALRVVAQDTDERVHVAVVDAGSPEGISAYRALRETNPGLVSITISEQGLAGDSPYKVESRSLFLKIIGTLTDLIEHEHGVKKRWLPAEVVIKDRQATRIEVMAGPHGVAASDDVLPGGELYALVVDDSLAVREQLCGALRRLGINSESAEHAEMALSMIEQCRFDIAFLDVVMPGSDGYELCRNIRRNPHARSMPVLMLTSRSSPFDRARGMLAGCDHYLTKPITWETFSRVVDKALMKHFRNDRAQLAARGYRG
ncbi:MAG: response regulator [Lysobacteraceae bacterium]